MITEHEARTLFRADPVAALDPRAVLTAAHRARRRRAAVTGTVALAGVAAAAFVATSGGRAALVQPVDPVTSPPSTAGSPSHQGRRFETAQVGNAVAIASYTEAGDRRDVYAYFARSNPPGAEAVVMVCVVSVGADGGERDLDGCHGPALPGYAGARDVGIQGGALGGTEDGRNSTYGPLGRGFTFTVVSTRVYAGQVVDDTGARHQGRVLGIGDPTLPARFLVADLGERYYRDVALYDENGRPLPQGGGALPGADASSAAVDGARATP